jgi:glycosyltransferase involved in cell wall biosynthesis
VARIALVHDIAGVADAQAAILRRAGHQIDQIRLPDFGPRWHWLAKAVTMPLRVALYLPAIVRIARTDYDVIHIHWITRGLVGVLAGKPFLIQAHGSDVHKRDKPGMVALNRAVLKRATTIFYVTPNLKGFLSDYSSRLRYLPNPVNVPDLALAANAPDGVRSIFIFMRLDPVKAPQMVFPGVARLAAKGIALTALAWGPLTAEYVRDYGSVVRFVDPVQHAEMNAFLRQFDLVVGQMKQGILGLSELEAMAAGRPVITAIDRSLYQDDDPPVVLASNPDELVDEVERLRNDPGRLQQLSRDGRAYVSRNHGDQHHLAILEAAYFGSARQPANSNKIDD